MSRAETVLEDTGLSGLENTIHIKFEDLEFVDGGLLGKGQFGEVLRARLFGTDVCVKRIFHSDDADLRKYIDRELQVLKSIHHPHVMLFIGFSMSATDFYIVTEYLEGGDLRRLLKSQSTLPWNQRVQMALDIARALAYLHSINIIHRDLKSANCLVTDPLTRRVKICDFGFARTADAGKRVMTMCGTDEWMAPEVILGMEYDRKADIFSYGILLAEIITRRRPSDKKGVLSRSPQSFFGLDFNELRSMTPSTCPPGLLQICFDCCEYEPGLRPEFFEVVQRLQELLLDDWNVDEAADKVPSSQSLLKVFEAPGGATTPRSGETTPPNTSAHEDDADGSVAVPVHAGVSATSEPAPEPAREPTPEPAREPTPEPAPAPKADVAPVPPPHRNPEPAAAKPATAPAPAPAAQPSPAPTAKPVVPPLLQQPQQQAGSARGSDRKKTSAERRSMFISDWDRASNQDLEALILRATNPEFPDPEFVHDLLLTFVSFTTPERFLHLLAVRFQPGTPTNTSLKIIRLRILNLVRIWLDHYFLDFLAYPTLAEDMSKFINEVVPLAGFKSAASAMQRLFQLRQQQAIRRGSSLRKKKTLPSQGPSALMEFGPIDIASQFTLLNFDMLRDISGREFLDVSWTTGERTIKSPNLHMLLTQGAEVSNWVATEILKRKEITARVSVFVHFVAIAEHCLTLNNFQTCFDITKGLLSSPIKRLKKTMKLLTKATQTTLRSLSALCSNADDYRIIRKILSSRVKNPPCIPPIDVYLQDLENLHKKYPALLDNDQVNVPKFRATANVINTIKQCTVAEYATLAPNDVLQTLLFNVHPWSMTKAMEVSESFE